MYRSQFLVASEISGLISCKKRLKPRGYHNFPHPLCIFLNKFSTKYTWYIILKDRWPIETGINMHKMKGKSPVTGGCDDMPLSRMLFLFSCLQMQRNPPSPERWLSMLYVLLLVLLVVAGLGERTSWTACCAWTELSRIAIRNCWSESRWITSDSNQYCFMCLSWYICSRWARATLIYLYYQQGMLLHNIKILGTTGQLICDWLVG